MEYELNFNIEPIELLELDTEAILEDIAKSIDEAIEYIENLTFNFNL